MGHWRVVIAMLACTMFLANMAPFHNSASAEDTIRLGFVADATGAGEPWYKSQRPAIDMFIEETNAAGGILGRKLELVVRDSALKPDLGEAAAEELITKEKCDFLLGPSSSGVAERVTKVAKKYKKIVVFFACNSEGLTTSDFQPYMFEVVPNTGIESRGVAQFFALRQFKRFSYIGPDYNYARNWFANFKTALTKVKPDVQFLSETWVKLGEMNFAANIQPSTQTILKSC
jgi:branched-chain amino acid transport system substrate-binding protein